MHKDRSLEGRVRASAGHMVSQAARGFVRLSEARLKPLGFGVGYLPVLVMLTGGRRATQSELARVARIEQPSMAQMLTRMERDGLIRRERDPDDGRSSLVSLTERAEATLPGACVTLFQGNREALVGFSKKETAQLLGLLARVIQNLERLGGVGS